VNRAHDRHLDAARVLVLGSLLLAYVVIAVLVNTRWQDAVVLNHFAYLPIALAAIWWGRRGALVALVPVATLGILDALGLTAAPSWPDAVRGAFFLAAGLLPGTLADRLRYVPIGGGCLLEYSTSSGNVYDYSLGWRDWNYYTTSPRMILQPEPWQAARQ